MIDWLALKILISFYKIDFFHIYSAPLSVFKKFQKNFTQAVWPPLVLSIFHLPCQLWGVLTFGWVCADIFKIILSHIYLSSRSFIKIWDGSCPALVHLTWNNLIALLVLTIRLDKFPHAFTRHNVFLAVFAFHFYAGV